MTAGGSTATHEELDELAGKVATALSELECGKMCYLSWHLFREKFGEMKPSGI